MIGVPTRGASTCSSLARQIHAATDWRTLKQSPPTGDGVAFEIDGPFGGLIGNVRVPLDGLQPAERRPSGSSGR
jgi:hypothetical protein